MLTVGSSPLTRGKRVLAQAFNRLAGLIPAHAGKTAWVGLGWLGMGAHPRSRGENADTCAVSCRPSGSSPLTRGKLNHPSVRVRLTGLIPAHAGKTELPRSAGSHHRAHPHSCGENSQPRAVSSRAMGSSPLTRGKRVQRRRVESPPGLIPAHAGKTGALIPAGAVCRAHPRSRGEN